MGNDNYVTVSDINPRLRVPSEWKWRWWSEGRLVNIGTMGYVCRDDITDCNWYYSGQEYVSFRTLAHSAMYE